MAMKRRILGATILFFFFAISNLFASSPRSVIKIKAIQDAAGDWMLSSIPMAVYNSEQFQFLERIGTSIYVTAQKHDNKWKANLQTTKGWAFLPKQIKEVSINDVLDLILSLNETVPDEPVIVIRYWVRLREVMIHFGADKWKNESFHRKAAEKLNQKAGKYNRKGNGSKKSQKSFDGWDI